MCLLTVQSTSRVMAAGPRDEQKAERQRNKGASSLCFGATSGQMYLPASSPGAATLGFSGAAMTTLFSFLSPRSSGV
jgi:hypothetical protein